MELRKRTISDRITIFSGDIPWNLGHWSYLIGGLEHDFFDFPFSWEVHHHWQTHIFQRGRYTTNQLYTNGLKKMATWGQMLWTWWANCTSHWSILVPLKFLSFSQVSVSTRSGKAIGPKRRRPPEDPSRWVDPMITPWVKVLVVVIWLIYG